MHMVTVIQQTEYNIELIFNGKDLVNMKIYLSNLVKQMRYYIG